MPQTLCKKAICETIVDIVQNKILYMINVHEKYQLPSIMCFGFTIMTGHALHRKASTTVRDDGRVTKTLHKNVKAIPVMCTVFAY